MEFPNLRAAFGVMAVYQGYSSKAEHLWRTRISPMLHTEFPAVEVVQAEILLSELREPNDEINPFSPLWEICCGDSSEWSDTVKNAASENKPLNKILEEMFGSLG